MDDEYLFGVIVRERLAEARERAAIEYLVRSARPRARRRRARPIQRLFEFLSSRRLHRPVNIPPRHLEGWH